MRSMVDDGGAGPGGSGEEVSAVAVAVADDDHDDGGAGAADSKYEEMVLLALLDGSFVKEVVKELVRKECGEHRRLCCCCCLGIGPCRV